MENTEEKKTADNANKIKKSDSAKKTQKVPAAGPGKAGGKRKKKRQLLVIAILLMLLLIAAALLWLTVRGRDLNRTSHDKTVETIESIGDVVANGAGEPEDIVETLKAAEHVYSHRGSAGKKEHSFEAYDEAIAAGSVNIEQDLVISKDGVLFVSHDLSAEEMTGTSKDYAAMTADEIEGLKTKAGGKVLRMSEVFDRYGRSVNYIIELKAYEDSRMIDAFTKIVDKYGYEDIITVQCQDFHVLRNLESIYPDMTKLYVCRSEWGFDHGIDEASIDIISVQDWLMTESRCQTAHNRGLLFSAWTLNSEEDIRKAIDMGVDTYFTDDTALAISIEKDYGAKHRK